MTRPLIEIPGALVEASISDRGDRERIARAAGHTGDPEAFFMEFGDSHRLQLSEDGTRADLTLYGAIGGFFGIDGAAAATDIRDLGGDVTDIDVRLDSPGGSVFEAVLIYNALVDSPANVTVTVDAKAASAASFLLQAGDRRIMNRGSMAMVHGPWMAAVGPAATLEAAAEFLIKNRSNMADIYAGRSADDADTWLEMLSDGEDHWFSASEAVGVGLADEVVKVEPPKDRDGSDADDETDVDEGTPEASTRTADAVRLEARQRAIETAENKIAAAKAAAGL